MSWFDFNLLYIRVNYFIMYYHYCCYLYSLTSHKKGDEPMKSTWKYEAPKKKRKVSINFNQHFLNNNRVCYVNFHFLDFVAVVVAVSLMYKDDPLLCFWHSTINKSVVLSYDRGGTGRTTQPRCYDKRIVQRPDFT